MRTLHASLVLLVAVSAATSALPQTSPARGPIAPTAPVPDDQPMADYLGLLQQIAPAAADAARTYVAAVRLRCGQALDSTALRQAMARDGGDPVLMGLIRAAAAQDTGARHRLVDQMRCDARGAP